ncbi:diguanylate cyclase [Shewanella sp. SG44-6]|nr:diguanylate cyclase [Shewanella sp. SG44-6]MBB1388954.1 diguanylate cyclase [Shewanella sp. SG44-6]
MALTISLGVAQYNSQDSADSILERADKALYKAKSQGRNCVAVA